jgi:hypothetical protein
MENSNISYDQLANPTQGINDIFIKQSTQNTEDGTWMVANV